MSVPMCLCGVCVWLHERGHLPGNRKLDILTDLNRIERLKWVLAMVLPSLYLHRSASPRHSPSSPTDRSIRHIDVSPVGSSLTQSMRSIRNAVHTMHRIDAENDVCYKQFKWEMSTTLPPIPFYVFEAIKIHYSVFHAYLILSIRTRSHFMRIDIQCNR